MMAMLAYAISPSAAAAGAATPASSRLAGPRRQGENHRVGLDRFRVVGRADSQPPAGRRPRQLAHHGLESHRGPGRGGDSGRQRAKSAGQRSEHRRGPGWRRASPCCESRDWRGRGRRGRGRGGLRRRGGSRGGRRRDQRRGRLGQRAPALAARARGARVASKDRSSHRPAYTPPSSGSTRRSTTSGPSPPPTRLATETSGAALASPGRGPPQRAPGPRRRTGCRSAPARTDRQARP